MTGIARYNSAQSQYSRATENFSGSFDASWASVKQYPALPQSPQDFKAKVAAVATKPVLYQPPMKKEAPIDENFYAAPEHTPKTMEVFGKSFTLPEMPKFDLKMPELKLPFGNSRAPEHTEAAA